MSISVTCPCCQAAARVPEDMLGQVVRCPHCLMPFRTPALMRVPAPQTNESSATPPEEPPLVAAATGPIDDFVVPVVRVKRPTIATSTKKRSARNAGLRAGLVIGAAVFLVFAAVGAGLFIMAVGHERRPTFHRGFMQPPPPLPAERLGPGDPAVGIAEFVARSRPRPKPLTDVRLPDSRECRAALAGPRRSLEGGFVVTPVRTDDAVDTIGLCWAANADAFLALSRSGRLHRIADSSLEELRRLDIGQGCGQLTMSGEGLLVTLPRLEEVWVIDPDSLAVRRRIGVAGLRAVVSGPDLAIAFAFARDGDGDSPLRIDLTTGLVSAVALFQASDGAGNVQAHNFRNPALTADGRFMFAAGATPVRYRVEEDRLTFETADMRAQSRSLETVISSDGRWVSAASHVYPADDLNRPAFSLPATATAVGFDTAGQRVFVSSRDHLLTIYDLTGRRGPTAALPDRHASVRQLLVHPAGAGVLLRTDIGVLRVETPAP
jgi:hypothetical protein